MNQALLAAAHWEINVGFAVSVLFPVVTRFFWPWNESEWGWNIVSLDLSIAGTLLASVLKIDFGIVNNPLVATQVAFLALVIANLTWRTVIIWQTQREGAARSRREKNPDQDDSPFGPDPSP